MNCILTAKMTIYRNMGNFIYDFRKKKYFLLTKMKKNKEKSIFLSFQIIII